LSNLIDEGLQEDLEDPEVVGARLQEPTRHLQFCLDLLPLADLLECFNAGLHSCIYDIDYNEWIYLRWFECKCDGSLLSSLNTPL
jgi:hypothetical protein